MVAVMTSATKRRYFVINWSAEARVLMPHTSKFRDQERQQAGMYHVSASSSPVFFVQCAKYGSAQRVDYVGPSCSCFTFHQSHMACWHIIATLRHVGRPELEIKAFHPAFSLSSYMEAFRDQTLEIVIDNELSTDTEIQPSSFYRQSGCPRKRRHRSGGEVAGGRTYRCQRCSENGHNRATCTHFTTSVANASVLLGESVLPDTRAAPRAVMKTSGSTTNTQTATMSSPMDATDSHPDDSFPDGGFCGLSGAIDALAWCTQISAPEGPHTGKGSCYGKLSQNGPPFGK